MRALFLDGKWIKDEQGRTRLLRGVNLGGSSKVPYAPNGATHLRESLGEHRAVSFVNRPFPLEEADTHFRRLRQWGLTFVRFLITWEAIEHAGPGQYDEAYLDYLRAVVQKAGKHGIEVCIDPHQDVWSRFSGGDGAPGWTLELAGFNLDTLHETGAAFLHAGHDGPLPAMIWPTNGSKLAAATMFTLFFGGNDFAPQTRFEGEPAQEYLQRHYIQAVRRAAERLSDLPNVVGYDTLNEPLAGYIGWKALTRPGGLMLLGPSPSPWQSMLLGEGLPQEVGVWRMGTLSLRRAGRHRLNPQGKRAWLPGRECIWKQNGVWGLDEAGQPRLLRPDHFWKVRGREVNFSQDYYRPFANLFASAIRQEHPQALIFIETHPEYPPPQWGAEDAGEIVYAPHWYDGMTLVRKMFYPSLALDTRRRRPVFGGRAIRSSFAAQLAAFQEDSRRWMENAPVLMGEFGIPFDLDQKKAYRSGDYSLQTIALDRTFQALEDSLSHGTLWNYTADNTHEYGDQWNGEDLSIFSQDDQDNPQDVNSGGRALRAVVRPYPRCTAGEMLELSFDFRSRRFAFRFRHDPAVSAPTMIFLPLYQYPQGCQVTVSDGEFAIDWEEQTLCYRHSPEREEHTVVVTPK